MNWILKTYVSHRYKKYSSIKDFIVKCCWFSIRFLVVLINDWPTVEPLTLSKPTHSASGVPLVCTHKYAYSLPNEYFQLSHFFAFLVCLSPTISLLRFDEFCKQWPSVSNRWAICDHWFGFDTKLYFDFKTPNESGCPFFSLFSIN